MILVKIIIILPEGYHTFSQVLISSTSSNSNIDTRSIGVIAAATVLPLKSIAPFIIFTSSKIC